MGQELICKARLQGRLAGEGKAQLETDYLLFRGSERIKIALGAVTAVKADGGVLRLEFAGGPAELELGAAAEKWAQKILNPPSRIRKLGVAAGLTVRLEGQFEPDFLEEIAASEAVGVLKGKCDLLFVAAVRIAELDRLPKWKAELKAGGALWVVYPKGHPEIKEVALIQAGRAAGMKDVKVVRFSATHTALKFI
jgi:hypothetical protein